MADVGLKRGEREGARSEGVTQERPGLRSADLVGENGLTAIILATILIFAFLIRVQNVNWDDGQHLHPDERFLSIVSSEIRLPDSVGQYFDTARSPLNPYLDLNKDQKRDRSTFVYGTFPLFLNKAVAEWLDKDPDGSTQRTADWFRSAAGLFGVSFQHPNGSFRFDGEYESHLVGRVLSAVFDLFTIALVFELGRVMFSKRAGLLAAALLSLTVLHIQYSHFFGMETFLAFFVTAVLYFSVRITKSDSRWNYVAAGLAYGLALATKLSALPVLVIPALAVLIRSWPQVEALWQTLLGLPPRGQGGGEIEGPVGWRGLAGRLLGGVVMLVVAGIVFRTAQPYAFNGPGFFDVIDVDLNLRHDVLSMRAVTKLEFLYPTHYFAFSEKYLRDIAGLRNQQSGSDFPPNIQWIARPFLIFPLKNMVFFGLGAPMALAAAGSVAFCLFRIIRRGDFTTFLPLFWAAFFFLFIARGFNPTMRYFIPIYPGLIVVTAFGLVSLWDFAASERALQLATRLRPGLTRVAPAVMRCAVVLTLAGAFLWAIAFLGVYRQDISRVQASKWMAVNLRAGSVLSYQEWDDGLPLNIPGVRPDEFKHVTLKPYIPDSPEKVVELVSGLSQVDYVVESSNRLYDSIPRIPARYPSTTLYYKYLFDGSLGFEKVVEFHNYPRLFGIDIPDQWAEEAFSVYDHPKVTIWKKTPAFSVDRALALLQPAKAAGAINVPPKDSATNALLLRPDDLATQRAGGTWTDVFAGSGFATTHPALYWLIVLELAGIAATPFALVLFRRLPDRGYLLAKPLGLLALGYAVWLVVSLKLVHFERSTILGCLVLLLAGAALVAAVFWDELGEFLRRNWRTVAFGEVLFLVAFLVFYEFRLMNPDLWHPYRGGEKPMDLAYLTAITRSTTLPPFDPWFAGGYINYYYLGQFFTATLTRLTGISPEVAFNLAVPTYFAFTVAAVYCVAFNMAAAARRLLRRSSSGRPIAAWSAIAAGLAGAFFVAVLGNLDGVGELVERLSAVSTWNVHSGVPLVGSVTNSIGGLWQVAAHGAALKPFDYWRPSRILTAPQGQVAPITEFPYFTFLFADLHAHMMAIPFGVLSIGGSLAVALGLRGDRSSGREWALIALLGLITGSLRWLNSWDYPPFLLLAVTALVIGERRQEGGLAATALRLGAKSALLVGLSVLLYLPFLRNYASPVSGLHASEQTTALHQYLAHFGLFLGPVGALLLFQFYRALRASPIHLLVAATRRPGAAGALRAYDRLSLGGQLWLSLVISTTATLAAVFFVFLFRGKSTIGAMIPALALIAYLALRELRLPRPDAGLRLFLLAILGLAFGLSLGVDLVTLNGDITRMNTVFKFYIHAWVLFGLAASFALWYLIFVVRPDYSGAGSLALLKRAPRFAGALAVGALVAGAAIYPVLATPVRLDERFVDLPNTLDGAAFMEKTIYQDAKGPIELKWDWQGIEWLRANVAGSPTIIEGRSDLYRWGSRFSIYTGLPTVLGWDWHQKQQRGKFGGPIIDQRARQVDQFFSDPDPRQALKVLSQYDVSYVIVGQLERLYYPAPGLAKFDTGLAGALEVVYVNPRLTIYRVALGPGELARRAFP